MDKILTSDWLQRVFDETEKSLKESTDWRQKAGLKFQYNEFDKGHTGCFWFEKEGDVK